MSKPAVVLIKRFTYRGSPEEWSNKYFFNESPPTTDADWKTLVDALIAKEKTIYSLNTKAVRAYCYQDGDNDADVLIDYTALGAEVAGTMTTSGGAAAPGDTAAWLRWATTKENTRGKTVYLRKYYHDVWIPTTGGDGILGSQRTAYLAFANSLNGTAAPITGFTMCGADGTAAGSSGASTFATTRTLKRRGKRPPS
jgi:hypothetical protein